MDPYDREARFWPGLFVLLPVSVLVAVLGHEGYTSVSISIAALGAAGGPAILADVVRTHGLNAQKSLFRLWGGAPTTSMLRLRDSGSNAVKRDKWRKAVSIVTGNELPSAEREAASPVEAAQEIESVVDDLRDLLRDHERFPLLWRELRTYGRRRNLYGMRSTAITLAAGCSVMHAALLMTGVISSAVAFSAIAINLLAIVLWLIVVREGWVRSSANQYAFRLFQAAVTLAADYSAPKTRSRKSEQKPKKKRKGQP